MNSMLAKESSLACRLISGRKIGNDANSHSSKQREHLLPGYTTRWDELPKVWLLFF
ncbi:DUF4113 domain-containing protein [Marinomonas sp.]|uniref:DUF4113 domain-containing protein n=1 Tax=Marinomonas sp. TaxID=1904862 RepID=UPI003BAA501E